MWFKHQEAPSKMYGTVDGERAEQVVDSLDVSQVKVLVLVLVCFTLGELRSQLHNVDRSDNVVKNALQQSFRDRKRTFRCRS